MIESDLNSSLYHCKFLAIHIQQLALGSMKLTCVAGITVIAVFIDSFCSGDEINHSAHAVVREGDKKGLFQQIFFLFSLDAVLLEILSLACCREG